jgi:CheY-like chemotaxis protein
VAGNTLLAVINDVLDFSKIEAGCVTIEQAEFHLDDVLTKLGAIMSIEATKKQIALIINAPDSDIGALRGDRLHLKQILINLVGNAIKFTGQGQVRVDVSILARSQQHITLRFAVSDTGIGIAPDRQNTIFDSFAQEDDSTTRRFGGTGLGLTISHRLVALMQGTMGVISEQGKGSQFWFSLRFARAPGKLQRTALDLAPAGATGQAAGIGESGARPRRLSGLRILVVDDCDINRDVAQRILSAEGASVTLANDGRQAVDTLLAQPSQVDLVLMDVQMPEMDGYQATRLIRASPELAALPIIALTAGAFKNQEDAARSAGMSGFVSKPFDVDGAIALILRLTGARATTIETGNQAVSESADCAATLPGIALDAGLANWKDATIYKRYLRKFARDYAHSVHEISAKLGRAEPLPACALAHKLQGAAASLALVQVPLLARELQQVLRSHGDQVAALAALQGALDIALASIAQYAPDDAGNNEETSP